MRQEILKSIEKACQDFGQSVKVELARPDEQFGDYSTNVAMQLAKQLQKNPREIAEQLASKIKSELKDKVSEVAIAGPGFLNIRLSDESLASTLSESPAQTQAGKLVLAEYSDPNPFKPLHAGHLYTTLVGDVIARLLEASGAKVIRLNYGGDVGLHVGKSMWGIIQRLGGEHPEKLSDIAESERAAWLGQRYVEGNSAYKDDEAKKQEIIETNKRVYRLHEQTDHSSPFAQIYWETRQWSYDYFKRLYQELEVHPFDRVIPESEIVPLGLKIVKEQLDKGVYKKSDGAVVFEGEKYGLHTRVFITSGGLPTYEAKDVGLLLTKWQDYHFDQSVVITANEQKEYMEVMLKSVEQFYPEPAQKSRHLTHGVVKLAGGVKMSSREGNIVGALDILEAATAANRAVRGDQDSVSTLGAVKYAFLKQRIGGDIIYNPEESVALEGNSGPYLQYAHARACSILAKTGEKGSLSGLEFDAAERSLLRKITQYVEIVDKAAAELMPHHICTYLYELAQAFNNFYEHNRVIGDSRESVRLALVSEYAKTLKRGLELLGITAPEKM